MSKRMSGMVPQKGQIIGCWFPIDESPESPGPKFRPACVVAVNSHMLEEHPKIGLIYGTGQATTAKSGPSLKPHEFELEKGEGGNFLPEQTRFDCSRFVWLPFTEKWFKSPHGTGSMTIGFGKVPDARLPDIRDSVAAGQAKLKPAPSKPGVILKVPRVSATATTLSLPKRDAGSLPPK